MGSPGMQCGYQDHGPGSLGTAREAMAMPRLQHLHSSLVPSAGGQASFAPCGRALGLPTKGWRGRGSL